MLLPLTTPYGLWALDVLGGLAAVWLAYKVVQHILRRSRTTPLTGPPNPNWLLGVGRQVEKSPDPALMYEQWSETYGPVYRVPATLGFSRVVLCDPKAILHFYSHETFGYVQTELMKRSIENIVGKGVLWAEGESHKRQRKALTPAFSNAAIRQLTSVFFDSAHKVKAAWDGILDSTSGDSEVLEVQSWMNHVSLDSVGIAGFSHDFGILHGKQPLVATTFDSFGHLKPSILSSLTFILGLAIPALTKIPTTFRRLIRQLNSSMGEIADELLNNMRKESEGEGNEKGGDRSIIGLLIRAENSDSELHMSQEEVMAQMKTLILAGYETTSISLTWCLVELCKKPETQMKLREELSQFSGSDPTWDQLTHQLPYLDAVVHETLRLHPPLGETTRQATADDIIPLSMPMRIATGELTSQIAIAKGQVVTVPIHCMNRATAFWGPNAKEFVPERWLTDDGIPGRAQEIQGHRHLLTFVDGPRICLGRGFALAEFKAVLSVLIRNYAFGFRDGPGTKIETVRGILPRPSVAGEKGARVPLRIRRLE
ncbi:cytochrome P450 [Wolfiporia cocos MD-104 SS10]|uniref:Cytochrome P450 n=1 Tax=Wolfiporia cocos (strain MD-104) TaxID=742152 RepID=A0A2H3JJI3_WOLCO|nr:cytochrome P450 [Wolfiporia cocos MD-104 SS10]